MSDLRLIDIEVQGFSGPFKIRVPANGEMVAFSTDVNHGDWKTALMRPGAWPTIPKLTECKVVGWMQNMYGVHIRVEHDRRVYDVPAGFMLLPPG